jgi:hypothetical protein
MHFPEKFVFIYVSVLTLQAITSDRGLEFQGRKACLSVFEDF